MSYIDAIEDDAEYRSSFDDERECLAEPEQHDLELVVGADSPHPIKAVCSCGESFRLEPAE